MFKMCHCCDFFCRVLCLAKVFFFFLSTEQRTVTSGVKNSEKRAGDVVFNVIFFPLILMFLQLKKKHFKTHSYCLSLL